MRNFAAGMKPKNKKPTITMTYPSITAIATGVACGVLLLAGCKKSQSDNGSPDTTVHNVFLYTPANTVSTGSRYAATVEEARNISVGFKTAGQITRLLVKEGDRVGAGQLIAMLDTVDYALGVNQLRVQYAHQKEEFSRKAQMHAAGNLSDNEYERAQAALRQLGLQLALNENKLAYCRLTAPTSGVVTKRNFEVSEMVDAGTPVFELMDNNHLEVVVDLPVNAYMRRNSFTGFVGRTAQNPERTYRLNMVSITPRADNQQLYRMKLAVGGDDAGLTPGMNMTVEIEGGDGVPQADDGESITRLPQSAVLDRDGASGVWAFNTADSTIAFMPVTLRGIPGPDGMVTVATPQPLSTPVVRAGVHHLTDGERVKVIEEKSATNPGNIL